MKLSPFVTEELLEQARACARARLELARSRGRSQPFGDPGEEKRLYIDGWSSLAEALVATWLDLPWNNAIVEDLSVKPPDCGTRVEVRWTPRERGHLIAHPTDADNAIMVLVCGELPEMEVGGWTTGADTRNYGPGQQARNPSDRWVPRSKLFLPELLAQFRSASL